MTSDQPIRHAKISDYLKVDFGSKTERTLYRLTGNVDMQLSNSKQLLLFGIEEKEKEASQRFEVFVDLTYLNGFNINDILNITNLCIIMFLKTGHCGRVV